MQAVKSLRAALLAALLGSYLAPACAAALLNWNAPAKSRVGSSFTVRLSVQSDQALASVPITLGFDRASLEVTRVSGGTIDGSGKVLLTLDARSGTPASVGSSRVDLQACKLEYSIVSPK